MGRTPSFAMGLFLALSFCVCAAPAKEVTPEMLNVDDAKTAFATAESAEWEQVFFDPCTEDWTERWTLDGKVGTVTTGEEGMTLTAGPEFRNDAHHMVLWTKDSYEGDVRIEYDYTRMDSENRCVNILYIQATGSGKGPYKKDIAAWAGLREVPAMKMYFNHMNAYHISVAAFPQDYIRARRYMPEKRGLKGTDLAPDYFRLGFFKTGVPHHITVIKTGNRIVMHVKDPEKEAYLQWQNTRLPPIEEGRIGLRNMFTRSARYRNLSIAVKTP